MSHFAVAVITAEKPTDEVLTAALQPFHEYECTGVKDKYVIAVDQTEEVMNDYKSGSRTMIFKDGVLLGGRYDEQFKKLKADSNWEYDYVIPEGCEEREVPYTEIYPTLEAYLKKYNGDSLDGEYSELTADGRYLRYTNPNKTWDWWVVGGRWSNYLLNKSGQTVDSCQLSELDLDAKIAQLEVKANEQYDYFIKCMGVLAETGATWKTWAEIVKEDPNRSRDECREIYRNQDAITILKVNDENDKKAFSLTSFFGLDIDDFRCSREEYVERNSNTPFQCYNLLIASEADQEHLGWYGGEMGWWGMGTQEDGWGQKYQDLLRSQPKDHYITIVDCHI